MAAKDRIQVVMDEETLDIIDRIPRQERSRFVRACIQHAQATGRRVCGLGGAPVGKVDEGGTIAKLANILAIDAAVTDCAGAGCVPCSEVAP